MTISETTELPADPGTDRAASGSSGPALDLPIPVPAGPAVELDEVGPAGSTEPVAGRRGAGRARSLRPTAVLVVWTVLVWGRPVLGHFATRRLSNPGDSESFVFYLVWNVHALTHGVNPFFTPNLYAPTGLDLGNAISIPSVSLLVAPVTQLFGGTAGYNAAFLLAILLCGLAVHLLAHELTGSLTGGTLAGALAVVSPYFLGHALSHLNLMWVAGLPFLAYLVVRTARGRLARRWLVGLVALTVAFTIGASTELVVTETIFAVVALGAALAFATAEVRGRLLGTLPWLAVGGALGVLLASPVILAALHSGIPDTVANDPSLYSTDLTNVVAPTHNALVGDSFFAGLRAGWLGNDAENTAYLPIGLVVLLVGALAARRSRLRTGLLVFAGVVFVFSLGPVLNIAGQHTLPMPWELTRGVPGLEHALPARFSAFVFMAVAVLVADLWATRALPRWLVGGATALSCVLLLPNLATMLFPVDASLPDYVTSGRLAEDVHPGEDVLVLPAGQWGPGMRWMEATDFSFSMPTGNGGGASMPPALRNPLAMALFMKDLHHDYATQLVPYLEGLHVHTVIVDSEHPEWHAVMERVLPGRGQRHDGVWLYHLP